MAQNIFPPFLSTSLNHQPIMNQSANTGISSRSYRNTHTNIKPLDLLTSVLEAGVHSDLSFGVESTTEGNGMQKDWKLPPLLSGGLGLGQEKSSRLPPLSELQLLNIRKVDEEKSYRKKNPILMNSPSSSRRNISTKMESSPSISSYCSSSGYSSEDPYSGAENNILSSPLSCSMNNTNRLEEAEKEDLTSLFPGLDPHCLPLLEPLDMTDMSIDSPFMPLNEEYLHSESDAFFTPSVSIQQHQQHHQQQQEEVSVDSLLSQQKQTLIEEQQQQQRKLALPQQESSRFQFVANSDPLHPPTRRLRRRYEEVERFYQCSYEGCSKSYGTLNHLNAHVLSQNHGPRRTPGEFKQKRRAWLQAKKLQQQSSSSPSPKMSS